MRSQTQVPDAIYVRAAPTMLGLASVAAIAIVEASRRKLGIPDVAGDTLQSLQSWLLLTATLLGLASHYVESRRVHGALAFAMALVFASAASAGILQIIFGPHDTTVLSACAALVSFVLAVVALHVAALALAPRGVHLAVLRHLSQSHRSDGPQGPTRVCDVLRVWGQRTRGRKQLGQLTEGQLRDIGLSRADAIVEANKPFWRA